MTVREIWAFLLESLIETSEPILIIITIEKRDVATKISISVKPLWVVGSW